MSAPAAENEPLSGNVRLSLLAIVISFGGSLPAYKLAGESFGPATTNLIRFVIAAAVMMVVARRKLHTARGHGRHLLVVGTFGLGLMALLIGIGVDQGSATIASIIAGLEPIGVALAGVLLVGDRPNVDRVVALVIGFAGALVAAGVFTERDDGGVKIVPIVVLLAMVTAFSLYTAFVRRLGQGVHPLAVSALTQTGALLFVIPACLFDTADGGMLRGDVTGKALAGVAFLGIGSAIAYLLLVMVLANVPANRVAVSLYLTPLIGVLLSWLVADERLHVRDAVGAALVLVAIWVSERSIVSRLRPAPDAA